MFRLGDGFTPWRRRNLTCLSSIAALIPAFSAYSQDSVRIEPPPLRHVFGERQVEISFDVRTPLALDGRLSWVHAVKHRTIARGTQAVRTGPGKAAPVEIALRIPPVNEGVVLDTTVSLSLAHLPSNDVLTNLDHPLTVFHADPFAGRRKWVEDLGIVLFDPHQTTARHFDNVKIPFESARQLADLERRADGTVVIAADVSWLEYDKLPGIMTALAARGMPVLCLSPLEGRLNLPGASGSLPMADRVLWRRTDVIAELDRRLDGWASGPAEVPRRRGLAIKLSDNHAVAEVGQSSECWPWLEVRYGQTGVLLVCGFDLMQQWEDGPVPRYLFARMLEQITSAPESAVKPTELRSVR